MRVAITGGIAEGKSTVLGYLNALGEATASADEMAVAVYRDEAVQKRLSDASGLPWPVERADLRAAMAASPALRRQVNAIMHPLVHERLTSSAARFIEVPLLFEACIYGMFDQVWVVTCGRAEQRKRLAERYGEGPQLEGLLATQLPSRAKTPFSDRVVRTNEAPETVRRLLSEAVAALYRA
jgi:dephospho-CoA kinase